MKIKRVVDRGEGAMQKGDIPYRGAKNAFPPGMKKTFILLMLSLLAFCKPSLAADPWSARDKYLEVTYFAFHLTDWGQTRDVVARKDEGYYEAFNPLLPRHPSRDQVDLWFITSGLLHLGITHFLPAKCRPYWQGVTIGVSGFCVIRNYSIGLHIRF